MNIAFLIERNVYFKTFGPLIDRALEMGHKVFCLHNYNQSRTGPKSYQFPYIGQTPKFQNGQVISFNFPTEDNFVERILANGIEAVISLDFVDKYLAVREKIKKDKVFWLALQNGFDTGLISGKNLSAPDKFFIYSWEWLEWILNYLGRGNREELKDRVEPVGFWLCEKNNLSSPERIRNKWGIPLDKKVVLLLPFPFGSSQKTFWTKYVYGTRFFSKQNDYNVCLAIRKFCDNNNATLLVKCRKKDPAKDYLIKMADKVIYDESFYPSTTMECFSIADICFNFYSTAAIESVAMGVSNVCIAPDTADWKDIQGVLWQTILAKEKDFFDFQGASYLKTISEIINNLPKQSFADFSFNNENQTQYLQKFANSNIETASLNIILEIEKLVKKE
ncbi:MAG: hypothetical protein AAB842_00755 [Patescibacteria group bacterium]